MSDSTVSESSKSESSVLGFYILESNVPEYSVSEFGTHQCVFQGLQTLRTLRHFQGPKTHEKPMGELGDQ